MIKKIKKIHLEADKKIIDNDTDDLVLIGSYEYKLKTNYINSEELSDLYTWSLIEKDKVINVGINLKHHIFIEYPENLKDTSKFNLIIEFIKCLAKGEVKALNSLNKASDVRHAFNMFSNTIEL